MPNVRLSPEPDDKDARLPAPQEEPRARQRRLAMSKVRWASRSIAVLATGAAAVLGLVVAKQVPGTVPITQTAIGSAGTTAASSSNAPTSTSKSATVVSGGTAAAVKTSTSPTNTSSSVGPHAPRSTSKSVAVVSGGTGTRTRYDD